jgi:phosphate/sulfate permease
VIGSGREADSRSRVDGWSPSVAAAAAAARCLLPSGLVVRSVRCGLDASGAALLVSAIAGSGLHVTKAQMTLEVAKWAAEVWPIFTGRFSSPLVGGHGYFARTPL